MLRQLNEEGEGLAEGSQAVLKGIDGPEEFRDAIAGSLVAQLDVDPKFIQAIEAALGRNLHAIILKDAKVASEIIGHLKKKKLGHAALLIPQADSSRAAIGAKSSANGRARLGYRQGDGTETARATRHAFARRRRHFSGTGTGARVQKA